MLNIKKSALSITAKKLETNGFGYRYEGVSTGTYLIQDSLKFEIEELGNEDVFMTLQKLYNINTNNVNEIIRLIYNYFNQQYVYGLWVSTKSNIEKVYIHPSDYEYGDVVLLKYKLPNKRLIISDLDYEGIWYATPVHPDNIPYQEAISKKYKGIYY